MHGLVSLLPHPYYEHVEELWKELEEDHGLIGIRVTPYPHFSWQIAQEYDFDRLEEIVREISAETAPFLVHTTGVGLFTGPRPVIFVPLVKSRALMDLHQTIWERTQTVSRGISPYYDPYAWMPHISLALEDVDEQNVAGVMSTLAFRPFRWEMMIDNLALIYEPPGAVGELKFKVEFPAKTESPDKT